jgi:transposase
MNGARFVHDQLELAGWQVAIADAQKVKGLAPLAAKTGRIDAWVLVELCRRDLVPEIWLPTPGCGPSGSGHGSGCSGSATGPRARTASTPPCWPSASPVRSATSFGAGGRHLLARLALPEPWIGNLTAALALIDDLDERVAGRERDLRHLGADHPSVPLLRTHHTAFSRNRRSCEWIGEISVRSLRGM